MTNWADGSGQAYQQLNDAESGVGGELAAQHAVTAEERAVLNRDMEQFKGVTERKLDATHPEHTTAQRDQVTEDLVASRKVGQCYELWAPGEKDKYLNDAAKQSLGDVNDPAERLKAMSFITQEVGSDNNQDGLMQVDKAVCGGASIVGAAYLAEGPEGLKKVMSAIEAQDANKFSTDPKTNEEYKKIRDKIDGKDKTPLTVADIQALQRTTYEVLRNKQDPNFEGQSNAGLKVNTMNQFMADSPELAEMMKKNNMSIEGVDVDGNIDAQGKRGMEHYVVRMKDKNGKEAIYDPAARRGGQIVAFDEGVDAYSRARATTIQN